MIRGAHLLQNSRHGLMVICRSIVAQQSSIDSRCKPARRQKRQACHALWLPQGEQCGHRPTHGMSHQMKPRNAPLLQGLTYGLRHGACTTGPHTQRAAMSGQVEGEDLAFCRQFRCQRVPDGGAAAEAVEQDQRKRLGIRPAPSLAMQYTAQRFAARSSSTRLAADTIASSDAATMFLLMPAPNSFPPGCSTST